MQTIKTFIRNEDGATAIEYGLITALVAVAIIVGLNDVATALKAVFTRIQEALQSTP